jgi:hypothetical protein
VSSQIFTTKGCDKRNRARRFDWGFNGGGRMQVPIYGVDFFSLALLSLTISVINSFFFFSRDCIFQ